MGDRTGPRSRWSTDRIQARSPVIPTRSSGPDEERWYSSSSWRSLVCCSSGRSSPSSLAPSVSWGSLTFEQYGDYGSASGARERHIKLVIGFVQRQARGRRKRASRANGRLLGNAYLLAQSSRHPPGRRWRSEHLRSAYSLAAAASGLPVSYRLERAHHLPGGRLRYGCARSRLAATPLLQRSAATVILSTRRYRDWARSHSW